MTRSRHITGTAMLSSLIVVAACGPTIAMNADAWVVDNATALGSAPCTKANEGGLFLIGGPGANTNEPIQPINGDWTKGGAFAGALLAKPYQCTVASVTVKRNAAVGPNVVWKQGAPVTLFLTFQHYPAANTKEGTRQSLAYSLPLPADGQSTLVFPDVIVISSVPGVGTNPQAPNLIDFGLWPDNAGSNALKRYGYTAKKQCSWVNSGISIKCPP